ncbi:MAG: tetratricopeptide repeat protein [Exilispira sp.]
MLSEEKKALLKYYNEGIELYFNKDFKNAAIKFQKALEIDPDDGPSKLQYLRCVEYIKNPPPESWDGVFTMVTK